MDKPFYFLILSLLVLISCDDEDKVTQLYAYPEWSQEKFLTSSVVEKSLYLFHYGQISKNLLSVKELKSPMLPKSMPHDIKVGGVAILSSYLKVLKDRFKDNAVFLSHGGLNFSQSDDVKRKILLTALNELPLDAILLSKTDILRPLKSPHETLEKTPWYNSNILSISTGEPSELFQSQPFKVIKSPSISIGLIGTTSYKLLTPVERNEISGFYFEDPVTTVLRTKNQLSKKGTDLIVLYFEGQLNCQQKLLNRHLPFSSFKKIEEVCEKDSELIKTLKRLPPNTIDLVITNSTGFAGALFRNIPIISLHSPQKIIQGIKLVMKEGNLDLEKSLLLEGVKMCHKVFVATKDCVFDLKNEDINDERFDLMEKSSFGTMKPLFLGHEVKQDPLVLRSLNDR